jgi:hypothetical protein
VVDGEHGEVLFTHNMRVSGWSVPPLVHLLPDDSALLVVSDDLRWADGMHCIHYGALLRQALATQAPEGGSELLVDLEESVIFRQKVDMDERHMSEGWQVVQYKDVRRWLHACCRQGEQDNLGQWMGE